MMTSTSSVRSLLLHFDRKPDTPPDAHVDSSLDLVPVHNDHGYACDDREAVNPIESFLDIQASVSDLNEPSVEDLVQVVNIEKEIVSNEDDANDEDANDSLSVPLISGVSHGQLEDEQNKKGKNRIKPSVSLISNWPFGCRICGKPFRDLKQLSSHIATHKQRPFECIKCAERFNAERDFNRHMHKVHPGFCCNQSTKQASEGTGYHHKTQLPEEGFILDSTDDLDQNGQVIHELLLKDDPVLRNQTVTQNDTLLQNGTYRHDEVDPRNGSFLRNEPHLQHGPVAQGDHTLVLMNNSDYTSQLQYGVVINNVAPNEQIPKNRPVVKEPPGSVHGEITNSSSPSPVAGLQTAKVAFPSCISKKTLKVSMKPGSLVTCPVCDSELEDGVTFRLHMREHNHLYPCECRRCGMGFKSTFFLLIHTKKHHEKKQPLKCPKCHETFPGNRQYLNHSSKHGKWRPFSCCYCEKLFDCVYKRDRHVQKHDEKEPLQCAQCARCFDWKPNLDKHLTMCGCSEHGFKECYYCFTTFDNTDLLKQHAREHIGEKPFMCVICGAKFQFRKELLNDRTQHLGEKPVGCEGYAERSFRKADRVSQSKNSAVRKTLSKYGCKHCEMRFEDQIVRDLHCIKKHQENECEQCQEIHHSVKAYKEHMKEKHPPFRCEKCKKGFLRKRALRSHLAYNAKNTDYCTEPAKVITPCSICGKKFRNKGHLRKHEARGHLQEVYQCDLCSKTFTTERSLEEHKESEICQMHQCDMCGKIFAWKKVLERHKRTGVCQIPPCNLCGKTFSRRNNLNMHKRLRVCQVLQCDHCDKTFTSKGGLTRHRLKRACRKKSHECSRCSKRFLNQSDLKSHDERNECPHTTDTNVRSSAVDKKQCSRCDRKFLTEKGFQKHKERGVCRDPKTQCLKVNSASKLKVNICSYCGKSFTRYSELKKHVRIHTGEKPYLCAKCGKRFSLSSSLVKHEKADCLDLGKLNSKRQTVKNYACDHCSESFVTYQSFEKHLYSHTDDSTRFLCSKCGKEFRSSIELARHNERTHNRKLQCHLCPKLFYDKKSLRTHLDTHMSVSYKCHVCEKSFSTKDYRSFHLRKFHNVDLRVRIRDKAGVSPELTEQP